MSNDGCQTSIVMLMLGIIAFGIVLLFQNYLEL